MEIIKPGTRINFVKFRSIALGVSILVIAVSVISFFKPGPNMGIDFAGGEEMEVEFNDPIEISRLRSAIEALPVGDVKVQKVGEEEDNTYLLRMEELKTSIEEVGKESSAKDSAKGASGKTAAAVKDKLSSTFGDGSYTILKTDYVGPRVGRELRNKGVMAIVAAMGLILVYITLRFEFRYALGAVIALVHDVLITTGAFIVTGREFNLAIIAALLTIVGYSLNDTIVTFDRIRENVRRLRRVEYKEMINISINEVLSRTLLTSTTTFITVMFLFFIGSGVIKDFAFALLVGVVIGTYSSIFVASSFIIWWEGLRAGKRTTATAAADKQKV
jgi:preprotein translocase subunit SecF